MNFVIQWVFKTVVGRWVTAILVTSLLAGAGYKWHMFKEDLIRKGQQVCVQEINKETVEQLKVALAAAKSARAELTARLIAVAAVNQAAAIRHREVESNFTRLQKQMENQRERDPNYKAWSDATLPDGVADRMRRQAARDNSSPLRDDQD